MELVLLYRGLWWGLSYYTEGCGGAYLTVQRVVVGLACTEGFGGACFTVQRVVMELVLLYRGLRWSLSFCTEGCDGACLTVQRVVVGLALLFRGL